MKKTGFKRSFYCAVIYKKKTESRMYIMLYYKLGLDINTVLCIFYT